MKYDWTQILRDIEGEPIPETFLKGDRVVTRMDAEGKPVPLTLGRACINALRTEWQNDSQTGAQKFDRGQLAYEIANKDPDLNSDQLALVKARVGRVYVSELVWRIWNILEGRDN